MAWLYIQYQSLLYSEIIRIVQSSTDAEDVLHTVIEKLIDKVGFLRKLDRRGLVNYMLVQRLRAIVETAHGEMAELSSYPGWQYARNSSLRETALAAYRRASVTVKERSAQPMAASNAAWLQQRSPTLTLSHSGRSCMMCIRRTSD